MENNYDRLMLQPRFQKNKREEDVYEDLCYVTFKAFEVHFSWLFNIHSHFI